MDPFGSAVLRSVCATRPSRSRPPHRRVFWWGAHPRPRRRRGSSLVSPGDRCAARTLQGAAAALSAVSHAGATAASVRALDASLGATVRRRRVRRVTRRRAPAPRTPRGGAGVYPRPTRVRYACCATRG
jgi:hypothetical protein